jgi:hypothetical protein
MMIALTQKRESAEESKRIKNEENRMAMKIVSSRISGYQQWVLARKRIQVKQAVVAYCSRFRR